MLMWVMSDRAIPRSYRMMDGFGVHTFRMINAKGAVNFVKFHWRPKLGALSLVWDEAVVINGADPDFHRRDLWGAIERGDFPEYELSVQVFTEKEAAGFDFDVLDPTKIVPEEIVPLRPLGRMVLDRNVDNFFAETEQVAFCPSHLVPGIDFSNDPLLQGRLFSYLDTQLSRLGGPNFHQIPINMPKCPVANFQRDGHMQMAVPTGRVSNEPTTLDDGGPREDPKHGFQTIPVREEGDKLRIRPESFADHYTQAKLFFKSLTLPEQKHTIAAFAFELGKCKVPAVRQRMLGRLLLVDKDLAAQVAAKLGMEGQAEKLKPAAPVGDPEPSPALSQYADFAGGLAGKKIGLLTTNGVDAKVLSAVQKGAKESGAVVEVITPKVGTIQTSQGKAVEPDHFLRGAPSALFDCVIIAPAEETADELLAMPQAVDWVRMAFAHLKVIGVSSAAATLLDLAQIEREAEGIVVIAAAADVATFIETASASHRVWEREPELPGV